MTAEELGRFYEAALTAGAITSGFIGTFLAFRIQREAGYYRQVVLDFKEEKAKDISINLSHFTSSFLLIIIAAICSVVFGVLWPLLALAHWPPAQSTPAPIVAGLTASVVLVGAYFVDELVHYRIVKTQLANDMREWKAEWVVVVVGVVLAGLCYCFIYRAISGAA